MSEQERVAVVGMGYVGLPVALAFAKAYPNTVGFDIKTARIEELKSQKDSTGEVEAQELADSAISFTDNAADLTGTTFFVVAVPTPISINKQPDLTPLRSACRTVGAALMKGSVVVFESTVYPGVSEEVCGPILSEVSGLTQGRDFKLAYSPERINPGDREHTLERIVKVVSGEDDETLERVAKAYERIIHAGVHRAPSIKVAEAAKVIENTQRDLNIALMNELALIFDRMQIRTSDVLEAAGTKWNFLRFQPGLVGGHCIGVDPYYLTAKAEELGFHPEVILAGRRINDGMGRYIAQRTVKSLLAADCSVKGAKVAVFGLTFKENVPDLRNSRVPDIVHELSEFGLEVLVHDPLASPEEAFEEYGVELSGEEALTGLQASVLAVPHREYLEGDLVTRGLGGKGVLVDVKSALNPASIAPTITYWSL